MAAYPHFSAGEEASAPAQEFKHKSVPGDDKTLVSLTEGDVVTGTIVGIDDDKVLLDIGYKPVGIIPAYELSAGKAARPREEVELGQVVDAFVLALEDRDGRLILSQKRVWAEKAWRGRLQSAWRELEQAANSRRAVEGRAVEVVDGGLIIDYWAVRGFLPASEVDISPVEPLEGFLDRQVECMVIDIDRSTKSVVLSRRAVLEERERQRINEPPKRQHAQRPTRRVARTRQRKDMLRTSSPARIGAKSEPCPGPKAKIKFATKADADRRVAASHRYGRGEVEKPLDHSYLCEEFCGWWHVSSEQRWDRGSTW